MQQYRDIDAIAIGRFDGMHLGHMALAGHLGPRGALLVIDTLAGDLTPARLLRRFIDIPYVRLPFESVRPLSPAEFVGLLADMFPALRRVVVGEDFRFGHGRSGDAETLRGLFAGETVVVPELTQDGEPVRSSRIRHHIGLGDMARARTLLGREHRAYATAREDGTLDTGEFLLPPPWKYPIRLEDASGTVYEWAWEVTDAGCVAVPACLDPGAEYALYFEG